MKLRFWPLYGPGSLGDVDSGSGLDCQGQARDGIVELRLEADTVYTAE